MLDAATITFLEGGCALIVGAVGPDGAPHVSRAWGLTVVTADPVRLRLLLAIEDTVLHALVRDGGRVAVTGTDVPTLRSLQLKGRAFDLEPASDDDRVRADRYTEAFFADVVTTDRHPGDRLERIRPTDYVAVTIEVDEIYVQTPGPGAGARWEGAA